MFWNQTGGFNETKPDRPTAPALLTRTPLWTAGGQPSVRASLPGEHLQAPRRHWGGPTTCTLRPVLAGRSASPPLLRPLRGQSIRLLGQLNRVFFSRRSALPVSGRRPPRLPGCRLLTSLEQKLRRRHASGCRGGG